MDYLLLVGLVAAWLFVILIALVLYQVLLQNGRLLLRVEAIEAYLSQPGADPYEVDDYLATLPVGVAAPAIDLPDLSGTVRSLSEWRGRRVLLVFFDPECTFSLRLLPYLKAMDSDPVPGRPVPLVVSTGGLEKNRALFDESGFSHPVLVQEGTEVAAAYKVDGTPMSYLVESDGTIASEVATGVQSTLILAGEMATVADATTTNDAAQSSLQEPVRMRDGIPEGTTAPVFRLPRLEGGELSLLEYRGRDVVLVFSDPDCEPCLELLPELVQFHQTYPSLALVMITRGDLKKNLAMAREYEISFPIVLQRHWEVSRDYGIFATPVAFHVDEWGITTRDVAVGPEAVLLLAKTAAEEVEKQQA